MTDLAFGCFSWRPKAWEGLGLPQRRGYPGWPSCLDGPRAHPILTSGHSCDSLGWQHPCHQKYPLEDSSCF